MITRLVPPFFHLPIQIRRSFLKINPFIPSSTSCRHHETSHYQPNSYSNLNSGLSPPLLLEPNPFKNTLLLLFLPLLPPRQTETPKSLILVRLPLPNTQLRSHCRNSVLILNPRQRSGPLVLTLHTTTDTPLPALETTTGVTITVA